MKGICEGWGLGIKESWMKELSQDLFHIVHLLFDFDHWLSSYFCFFLVPVLGVFMISRCC